MEEKNKKYNEEMCVSTFPISGSSVSVIVLNDFLLKTVYREYTLGRPLLPEFVLKSFESDFIAIMGGFEVSFDEVFGILMERVPDWDISFPLVEGMIEQSVENKEALEWLFTTTNTLLKNRLILAETKLKLLTPPVVYSKKAQRIAADLCDEKPLLSQREYRALEAVYYFYTIYGDSRFFPIRGSMLDEVYREYLIIEHEVLVGENNLLSSKKRIESKRNTIAYKKKDLNEPIFFKKYRQYYKELELEIQTLEEELLEREEEHKKDEAILSKQIQKRAKQKKLYETSLKNKMA